MGRLPQKLSGVDIIPSRIEEARRRLPGSVVLEVGNACNLRFADNTFDLALQFTAFSSVLDPSMRVRMAGEMVRVLRPGGTILWYDFRFNNPWNKDVVGMDKREIKSLFCECSIDMERLTLLPPLARSLVKISPSVAGMLCKTKVLQSFSRGDRQEKSDGSRLACAADRAYRGWADEQESSGCARVYRVAPLAVDRAARMGAEDRSHFRENECWIWVAATDA